MDPSFDPELLTRHTRWMRALAFELVGDAQGAEDVVQDAWLAALERRPRDLRNLPAWLGRVVRNRAATRGRGEGRRRRREQAVARPDREEREPGSDEALERFAVQRQVVEAVQRLERPDREVVVLRYLEELPPREIARKLGVSGAAVRSRLSRALDKLRRELDAAHGGDRQVWSLALVGWLEAPEAVAVAGTSLGAKLGIGLAGAAALLVVALRIPDAAASSEDEPVVALAMPEALPGDGEEQRALLSVAERADDSGAPASEERRAAPVEARNDADPEPVDVKQEYAGIVMRLVDPMGEPVPDVQVAVRGNGGDARTSGGDGLVHLRLEWPPRNLAMGFVYLDLEGPSIASRWIRTTVPAPEDVHLGDVVVEPGGEIRGRVVDSAGRPVGRALVHAGEPPAATRWGARQGRVQGTITLGNTKATTDDDGYYVLQGIPARVLCVFGRHPDGLYVFSPDLGVRAGETVEAPDLVFDPASDDERLRGIAYDPDGTPLGNVRLSVLTQDGLRLGGGSFTDRDGRFEILVPAARDHRLTAHHSDYGELELDPAPTGTELELHFSVPRWIDVVAVGAEGSKVGGLDLVAHFANEFGQLGRGEKLGPGHARLLVPRAPFSIVVDAVGWRPESLGPFLPERAPARLDVVLQPAGGFRGRLMAGGEPVVGASVHVHREGPSFVTEPRGGFACRVEWRPSDSVQSDDEGRFFLELDQHGPFELHAEKTGFQRLVVTPVDVIPPRIVDLGRLDWDRAGEIEGELVAADNPSGRIVAASRGDGHLAHARLGPDGRFTLEDLTPGAWQVALLPEGDAGLAERVRSSPQRILAGSRAEDLVDVRVGPGETAFVRLVANPSEPSTLSGELVLGGGPSIFRQATVSNGDEASYATVDAEGRFAARLEQPGPTSLRLTGHYAPGVRAILSAELELEAPSSHWRLQQRTGTVELVGLGEPADDVTSGDFRWPRYGLYRTPDRRGAFQLVVELARGVGGVVTLPDLPVGEYVLRGAPPLAGTPLARGPELALFTLAAGDFVSRDLGR